MLTTLIQITVFTSFLVFIYIKHGIITSISNSWYKLESQRKFFQFFMMTLAFLNIFHGDWPFLLSSLGLFGVAATPDYRKSSQEFWHGFSATIGIIFGYVGAILLFEWTPLLKILDLTSVAFAILVSYYKPKNFIFWSEVISFIGIMIHLLIGYA